jgi:hypothetical protein
MISSLDIISFFKEMNTESLPYVLIRNISGELPHSLVEGKDIDLLIKNDGAFERFLFDRNFIEVSHPHGANIFLYGVTPFRFFVNRKTGIILDLQYQLCCRSLNAGEWIPLDNSIQISAWDGVRLIVDDQFSYKSLSIADELACLIVRGIFDKKTFSLGYRSRISELMNLVQVDELLLKLEVIFFKYSSNLLKSLQRQKFDDIYNDYLQFKDY